MNIIDNVSADSLDTADEGITVVSLNGDEIEIRKIVDSDDINTVSFTGYSRVHDSIETYEVPFDTRLDILGD